jgi:hypothetical protein
MKFQILRDSKDIELEKKDHICWYCRTDIKELDLSVGIPLTDELISGKEYKVKVKGFFHGWNCVIALMKKRKDINIKQKKIIQSIFQILFEKRRLRPSYDIRLTKHFDGVLNEHQMSDHSHKIKFLNTFE